MKKTFLGQPIPEHEKPRAKRPVKPAWFGLLVLPALFAGGILSFQRSALTTETGPRSGGAALARTVASVEGDDRTFAFNGSGSVASTTTSTTASTTTSTTASGTAGTASGTSSSASTTASAGKPVVDPRSGLPDSSVVENTCTVKTGIIVGGKDIDRISEAFRRISDPTTHAAKGGTKEEIAPDVVLFPIIPDGLRGITPKGVDVTLDPNTINNWCTQPFWTIEVFYWFVYKGLAILNWLAIAAAIILTLYAGVLYMTGFANEANVKKAKSILAAAYIGLAIVFMAKIIVYAGVNAVSGTNAENLPVPIVTQ
jgi:hypothetical protein